MPPSQLKKLKASLHEQRTAKKKGGQPSSAPTANPGRKPIPQRQKETPAQRAHRIRQETLLPELQRRHKVGGIVDRRIGENDPTLAPEERMLQRYAAESQRSKRASIFNLEDDADEEEETLTHLGQPVRSDKGGRLIDDYDGASDAEASDDSGGLLSRSKRRLEDAIDEVTRAQEVEEDGQPARKKSKREVMEEVIRKSKFHKHERQQAREEDEDAREALDKDLPDLLAALRGEKPKAPLREAGGSNGIHADRAALISGGVAKDSEYDQRLRQMAADKRAQPTQRTKTDEEKAEEEAKRLEELEQARQRRMRGEAEKSSDESDGEEVDGDPQARQDDGEEDDEADEAAEFGFTNTRPTKAPQPPKQVDVEDEDDFIIDEDLVASGSEVDTDYDSSQDGADADQANDHDDQDDDEDAEFLAAVLPSAPDPTTGAKTVTLKPDATNPSLAYTYPCPQTHAELLRVLKPVAPADTPTVIQRIRALHHASLAAENKTKLAAFAAALVDHVHYMPLQRPAPPLWTIESVVRHVHSLSRTFAMPVALAFRTHLERMHADHPRLTPGDLAVLTAIGTIYPTSDHFHQVVTPAITIMARWLSTAAVPAIEPAAEAESRSRTGAYLVALCIRYQRLSRRYIPEAIRFTLHALPSTAQTHGDDVTLQHIGNLQKMAELWRDKSAFIDMMTPGATTALAMLISPSRKSAATPSSTVRSAASKALSRLQIMLDAAQLSRRPLELQHHRPQAIKTSIPQFETSFNPAKHYDADRERSEASRLRKEHRREKKGALRELRRDAEFVARQKLAEKKERDRAYEDKFRRIVGGIEREEGHEAKAYEREKAARRGKRF